MTESAFGLQYNAFVDQLLGGQAGVLPGQTVECAGRIAQPFGVLADLVPLVKVLLDVVAEPAIGLMSRAQRLPAAGRLRLFEDLHVWTADSATLELRAEWIRVLNDLEALAPEYVVAGHRLAGTPTDLTAITHTRDYLELFEKTIAASADAAEAEAALLAAYPDAGLKIAAGLGTKVAKGEMTWG